MSSRWAGPAFLAAVALLGLAMALAVTERNAGRNRLTPVTEAEALAMLDRVIAAASANGGAGLCAEARASQSFCQIWLVDEGYGRTVPAERPQVASSSAIADQAGTPPGWLLQLAGTDGAGAAYQHDFLVLRDARFGLVAPYPVYWRPLKVGPNNAVVRKD